MGYLYLKTVPYLCSHKLQQLQAVVIFQINKNSQALSSCLFLLVLAFTMFGFGGNYYLPLFLIVCNILQIFLKKVKIIVFTFFVGSLVYQGCNYWLILILSIYLFIILPKIVQQLEKQIKKANNFYLKIRFDFISDRLKKGNKLTALYLFFLSQVNAIFFFFGKHLGLGFLTALPILLFSLPLSFFTSQSANNMGFFLFVFNFNVKCLGISFFVSANYGFDG